MVPALAVAGVFLLIGKIKSLIFSKYQGDFDLWEEKINLLNESIAEKGKLLETLPAKEERVSFLFEISQNLIELIDFEKIIDLLIDTLEKIFPTADNILFFNFDKEGDKLILNRCLRRKNDTISSKKGNALDKWVLHQNRSLLIDDITKDFRFDYSKLPAYQERKVHSFILSPLSVGHKSLGVLRIEAKSPGLFSLDDSRLLRNISDLGAVVLERALLFQRAQDLAIKDSLTGLFVRSYFSQYLSRSLKDAAAKRQAVGLIMLDIDDFKKINDSYGHVVGDLVLMNLAGILKENINEQTGIVCRFGGEEFALVVTKSSRIEIIACAENILSAVRKTVLAFRRKKVSFTVSQGLAFYPDDCDSASVLIEQADVLLYKAKREGKNKLCYSGQ
ncbi:MAG: diguanylate cyclase [Candidatus Omnitrophica bacterium]|nr:diguanylate cyclase [Candidatus Omnitrophota bacterium]